MRYLRSPDLELVRQLASEAVRRRRPRRAARPRSYVIPTVPPASRVRAYAPWPIPRPRVPADVLNAVLDGLQRLEVTR